MNINLFKLKQLEEICIIVAEKIQCDISIMNPKGIIITSTLENRTGKRHKGSLKVTSGEVDSFAVTAEMAHGSDVMLEGYNFPLILFGKRIANLEIIAPVREAKERGLLAPTCIEALLVNLEYHHKQHNLQEKLLDFLDTTDADWTWEMDSNFHFTSFTDHKGKIDADTIIGKTCWEISDVNSDTNTYWNEHRRAMESHNSFKDFKCDLRAVTGERFYVSVNGKPFFDMFGNFLGYRGTTIDITEKRRLNLLRRRRSEVLELVTKNQPLEEILTALIKMSEELNPEMIGSILLMDEINPVLVHGAAPSLPDFYIKAIDGMSIGKGIGSCGTAAFVKEKVIVEEISIHPFWAKAKNLAAQAGLKACWSHPIFSSKEKVLGTFAMYYKKPQKPSEHELEFIQETANLAGIAIEKIQRNEEIRLLQNRLSNVINSMPSVLIGINAENKITLWNTEAENFTGISQKSAKKQQLFDVLRVLRPYSERVVKSLVSSQILKISSHQEDKEGKTHYFDITVYPLLTPGKGGAVIRIDEVTDRIEMEHRLNKIQKREVIGQLAGGIAHDFNNILMGVSGRVSLMKAEGDNSDFNLEHLEAIEKYIQNSTSLTKQLLGAATGGKYNPTPTDLNALLTNSSLMFGRTKKEIKIQRDLSQLSIVSEIDIPQLEQVLLNLYVNAWQAMPGGGELQITTSTEILDEGSFRHCKVSPGRYVKISIADTGIGMDGFTCQHVFDPFFTTKNKERGTGLGLASAYGIIKNHNGYIEVSSKVGSGTTFTIYLPQSDREPIRQEPVKQEIVQGAGTILLVDDEEMIIEVGQAMIKKIGYDVNVARGGQQAIEVLETENPSIDLVILDLVMPDMDGESTYDRICEIAPSTPVILSSGYSMEGQAQRVMQKGCNGFIQKPFSISELSQMINNVLGGGASLPPVHHHSARPTDNQH